MTEQQVAIVGARGGLGASTLALHLAGAIGAVAASACSHDRLDVLAGVEASTGLRWSSLMGARGVDGTKVVDNLPRWYGVPLLSQGAQPHEVFGELLTEVIGAVRARCPVVLDVPRTAVGRPEVRAVLDECDVVVVVAGRDVQSVAGSCAIASRVNATLRLVVRWHPAMSLSVRDVVDATEIRLAACMAHQSILARAVDSGVGPCRARPRWRRAARRAVSSPLRIDRAAARVAAAIHGESRL